MISSQFTKIAIKAFLYFLITILLVTLLYVAFICYDSSFSESGRLSKKINQEIESFIRQKRGSFTLKELTDFKWDKVCFYNEEGASIDLKDDNLIRFIGYKPKFLFRSKYFIDYDRSGLLFSNTEKEKTYVLHYLRAWYHLPNIKPSYNGCYGIKDDLTFFINSK